MFFTLMFLLLRTARENRLATMICESGTLTFL